MEIQILKLFSKNIQKQQIFYEHLGFSVVRLSRNSISIPAGQTDLHFIQSDNAPFYHFAFLIPTGQLELSIDFMKAKAISLLPFKGKEIIPFNSGRAIYFSDADGNIAEFIERPTLGYTSHDSFDLSQIIKINEIGVPVENPLAFSKQLIDQFDIELVEPDLFSEKFCWVGDYNGVFIVTKVGRNWLPTNRPAIVNDFEICFSSKGKTYDIAFVNNQTQKKNVL